MLAKRCDVACDREAQAAARAPAGNPDRSVLRVEGVTLAARTLVVPALVALFGLAVAGPSTHLPQLTVPAIAATAAGQEPTTSTLDDQVDGTAVLTCRVRVTY